MSTEEVRERTVEDIIQHLEDLTDEDRGTWLLPILDNLSPISKKEHAEFQNNWNPEGASFNLFIESLYIKLRNWVALECSETGTLVRKECGLPPMSYSDKVSLASIRYIKATN